MIEMQRTPARILKSRDLRTGEAQRPAALEPLAPASASISPAANDVSSAMPRPLARTAPVAAAPQARCVAKEARVVAGESGASAIEVRCSCGEWTRVELQVGTTGETR